MPTLGQLLIVSRGRHKVYIDLIRRSSLKPCSPTIQCSCSWSLLTSEQTIFKDRWSMGVLDPSCARRIRGSGKYISLLSPRIKRVYTTQEEKQFVQNSTLKPISRATTKCSFAMGLGLKALKWFAIQMFKKRFL